MNGLSEEVRQLIASAFDSVETLEIALLLRRSPQTFWAPPAIAEQLGLQTELVQRKVDALRGRGIVAAAEQSASYRYAPASEALKKTLDDLSDAYSARRVSVINTIYSANLERLRAFSNAFRVK